ncbi:cyclodeaminase/cyclohydrolase family protein [Microbacterium sp. GXF7504]
MPTPDAAAPAALDAWLAAVARPVPAPGGGAVAAVVTGHAAALTEMVLGYSAASPARDRALEAAGGVRVDALADAARDAAASESLVAAFRAPEGAPGRADAVAHALRAATACSVAIVDTAARLRPPLEWAAEHGDRRLRPDVAVAARLLAAAVRSAAVNIRCNAAPGDDGHDAEEAEADATRLADALDALAASVTAAL